MRVLWFSNVPLEAHDKHFGRSSQGSGWWMRGLLDAVRSHPGLELGVVAALPSAKEVEFVDAGVRYFVVPYSGRGHENDLRLAQSAAGLVRHFAPDLVHFHGTEQAFGLASALGLISTPAVTSIQGLHGPYEKHVWGGLSILEVAMTHGPREIITRSGLWHVRQLRRAGARREEVIIRAVDAVLGRTEWDRAHTWRIAPNVPYYHVGEVLRSDFSEVEWDANKCARHRIVVTNASSPMRGFEVVLDAVKLLVTEFPGIEVRLAAGGLDRSGYGRRLRGRIARLGLESRIRLLGWLDGPALSAELAKAHCFVLASYVENSPNSLCEAMVAGLPCVATFTGGVPSLVVPDETGLLFPIGESTLLAHHIRRVFVDDELACRLGRAARATARERHNPQGVAVALMAAYEAVLANAEDRRA